MSANPDLGVSDIIKNIDNKKKPKKKKLERADSIAGSGDDFYVGDMPTVSKDSRVSKKKLDRMRYRDNKKSFLLYPEDPQKVYWDLYITCVLLISCLLTPFRIAFGEIEDPVEWVIINWVIDGCFLVDIIIIFNSAYYDSEFIIVEDRKMIAKEYLSGWFLVDLLAIIPFEIFITQNEGNYEDFARIVRIGKISKLIKMTRILRILKIVKERSKLLKYLNEILKIGLGFERLVFFVMIFFICAHIVSCLQVISASF